MKRIRIGNDITIQWDVKKGGSPAVLSDKIIAVYMTNSRGRTNISNCHSVSESTVTISLKGEDLTTLGPYTFTLDIYSEETHKRYTIQDKCNVFELVGRSCAENYNSDEIIML